MSFKHLGLWPMRALWFVLAGLTAPGFGASLDTFSDRVGLVAEIGLWTGWFVGLVALLAPSTVSLTAFRSLAPAAVGSTLLAAAFSGVWSATTLGAIGAAAIICFAALMPWVGDLMINGSAYGPERRMALRPPGPLLLGPIQLTWLLMFVGLITGPLLLANGNYIFGGVASVAGLAVVWLGLVRLHQLSRRWVVFVPAGFVLHDYYALAESLLMRRQEITELGPAPLDKGELLDLTGGAAGLALMAQLEEAVPLALRAKTTVQTFPAHRIVFTPSLPGALLKEARIRGIKIS